MENGKSAYIVSQWSGQFYFSSSHTYRMCLQWVVLERNKPELKEDRKKRKTGENILEEAGTLTTQETNCVGYCNKKDTVNTSTSAF